MKVAGLDIETKNLKGYKGTVWMVSLRYGKKSILIEDCNGIKKLPKEVVDILEDESIMKVIHSGVFDVTYLKLALGCNVVNVWCSENMEVLIQGLRVAIKKKNIEPGSYEDRLLRAHSSKLMYTLPRYGFKEPDKTVRDEFVDRPEGIPFKKKLKDYAINDAKDLPALQKAQEFLLRRDGMYELCLIENKCTERLAEMRAGGIGFDSKVWAEIAKNNEAEFNRRIKKLPKTVENWNSEKQVKKFFASKGVYIDSYKDLDKTFLLTKNKTLGDFILARELHKAVTSYGANWFTDGYIDDDNRVRPEITQSINTGRMSFSNPNLQQLPGNGNADYTHMLVMKMLYAMNGLTKLEHAHRAAFVAKKGHMFVSGDFSGQEIGIMASASGEDLWINAMLRGEDVHSLTASLVNPTEWHNATEKGCTFPKKCKCEGHNELRRHAKINNFMLAYGGGPGKLAESTGMDELSARVFVAAHKRVIPSLSRYLEKCGRLAMDTGVAYSADPFRRRRTLRGEESWKIRNQGMNTPIQAAGANMLKLAMVNVPREYYIALVIHDEIILEVPKAQANKAAKVLKTVMEQSADYITGIKGLIRVTPKIATNLLKTD